MSSLSPSTPPATTPLDHSSTKTSFKNSVWRPVVTYSGALVAGLGMVPFLMQPAAPRGEESAQPILILPQETTMIVQPAAAPGATLKGEIRLVADVLGRAPVAGQVARQRVEVGARVKRGDAILEISSGDGRRAAPRAESLQNRAEQSQIAATDAQTALAQRVTVAQSRLRAAQERVERAQSQVASARDVVRRLQNGEAVSSRELPTPFRAREIKPIAPRRARRPEPNRAGEIALQQAQAAKEAAREGTRDLQIANQMALSAQKSAREAEAKLVAATTAVTEVEKRFEEKKAGAADVEAARAAQKEAQIAVTVSARALTSAKAEQAKREKSALALQKYADSAATDAKKTLSDVQVFSEEPSEQTPEPARDASRATLEQAIQFAGAALEESRRASRDAERIHAEIEDYERAAKNTNARIAESTQDLAAAQQQVLDSTPRPRFTAAYAPESGVVTWISRLAREVGRGESVFGIARGQRVGARFQDKTGLWRGLKKGDVVSALAIPKTAAASQPQSGSSLTKDIQSLVEVKITEIEPPASADEAAVVDAEVQIVKDGTAQNGAISPALSEGASVLASVARPGAKPTLSVPLSALVRRGDATYVAVLEQKPVEVATPALQETAKNESATTPTEAPAFNLRWNKVQLGRGDAIRQEVVSGLKAGSRVIVLPGQLQEMGFVPSISSPSATPDNDTSTSVDASQLEAENLLIRLTST